MPNRYGVIKWNGHCFLICIIFSERLWSTKGVISHVEGCKLQITNSCFIIYIYAWVPHNQNSPLANANCLIEKITFQLWYIKYLWNGFYCAILKYDIFFSNAFAFMGKSIDCISKLPLWQIPICGKCGSSVNHMPSSTWINNPIIGCGIGLSFQCCYVEHLFLIGVAMMEHPVCFIYLLLMTIF